jgi:hypothetical protein
MACPAPRRARTALLAVLLPCGVLTAPGCGILDQGEPERARVVAEGANGHPLQVVTTSDFDVVSDERGESREVFIFSADTADVTTPFDREYPLGSRTRIYVTFLSDSTASTPVTLRVFLDGDLRYDRSTRFEGEGLEFLYAASSSR